MAKIFISYTAADRDWAHWIGVTLRDNGHGPRVHEWELVAGGNIPRWMDQQIKDADYVLAIFSDTYVAAIYSGAERLAAFWNDPEGREGFLVPVEVKEVSVWPPLIKPLKRLSVVGLTEAEAEEALLEFLKPPRPPDKRPPFPGMASPAPPIGKVALDGPGWLHVDTSLLPGEPLPGQRPSLPVSVTEPSIEIKTEIDTFDGVPNPLNPDAFRRWLETKPREWSAVLAGRAALRALPHVSKDEFFRVNGLKYFRAIAIARFVGAYPMRASEAASMVASAADAVHVTTADRFWTPPERLQMFDAQMAVREAANTARRDPGAAAVAARAIEAGAQTLKFSGPQAIDAIKQDALALTRSMPPGMLARAPLWHNAEMKHPFYLGIGGEAWHEWVQWYDRVVIPPSPPKSEAWEAAFTDLPGPLPWDDGPEAVNLAIKERLEKLQEVEISSPPQS